MSIEHETLEHKGPGTIRFGGARMALFDIEAGVWGLRRQMEALVGRRLADAVLQQAGANGGASFAASFRGMETDDPLQSLRECVAAYQAAGFGAFEVEVLEWPLGRVRVKGDQTFEAWMVEQHDERPSSPVCAYTAGVLVGFVNVLTGRQDAVCIERACQALGDEKCVFELLPTREADDVPVVALAPDPALGRQLNLLELLFERMPMGILILDRELRIRRFNPTWAESIERHTPLTASQLTLGMSLLDLAPGMRESVGPALERVLDGETVRQQAFRFQVAGMISYWDAVAAPMMEEGDVIGVLFVTTDVTEQVQAEAELRQHRQHLEETIEQRTVELAQTNAQLERERNFISAVLDTAGALVLVLDREGRIARFNRACEQTTGYDFAEVEGTYVWDMLLPPAGARAVKEIFARLIEDGLSSESENDWLTKDGGRRRIAWSNTVLLDQEGQVEFVIATGIDVTEQRQFEAQIQEARDQLESRVAQRTVELERANQRLKKEIAEREEAERLLQYRSELENLITTISTSFINLTSDEIDQGIDRALRDVGLFLGVGRCYVFAFSRDGYWMHNTHEWCAPGIESQIDEVSSVPVDALSWSNAILMRGEVLYIPDLADLPAEAEAERQEFERQEICSLIAVPMMYQGEVIGFVGFDAVRERMHWSEESIKLLRMLGTVIANAVERKRAQTIQEGQRQFLELLATGGGFSETLEALVRIIEEQWPGMLGLVLLLDEDRQHLHLGASVSLPEEYTHSIEGLEIGPMVGSCGTASYLGERVIVEDIAIDPRWAGLRDLALKHGLRACWSEPVLSAHGEVVGTFAMYYRHPRAPIAAELETIEVAAHLVGIAIEHHEAQRALQQAYETLEQRVEERTRELSTLLEISHNVASTLELEPLLDLILAQLRAVVDYTGASVMTLDDDMLTVVAYRGPIPQADALQIAFSLHEARANREVIERQQPLVVANVNSGVPLARAIQDTAGESLNTTYSYVRSWIGVPLVAKDQVLGMVTLDHSEPEYYTARHAELAMAFAHQVAVAIENAGLYDETRRRAEEVQALFTVQQAITSRLDRGVVLQLIADAAQRLSATEQSAVYLLDGDELEIAVISGDVPKEVLGYRLPVMDSIAGLAIRTEEPVLVTDSRQDPRVHRQVADRVGARSFLIVPLVSGSGAIGTITVANKMAGSFGPDVEHLLTMLASSAVIGLENARLYSTEQERRQEAERRRQVAESLRDILTVLNSNRPLEKVLDQVVLQASRLLSAEAASIYRLQVEDELLTIEAARGLPDDYVAQMVVPLGGAAAGRAAMERQPVAVPDTRTADFRLSNVREELQEMLPRLRERYRALLGVPLIVKEDVYGAMVLYYGAPRPFQREEIELAQTFAEQAALAIETARLRAQAEQSAVLAERSRLARELHDAVTQTLFSASLIAEVLPRIWEANPEQGRRRLDELRELTRGALAEMRTLLVELRPSALVEADLGDLIQQLAESVTGRARLPVQVNIEGSGDLDPEVKIAFYRVAQEALNNVVKHAMATQAWVELWRQPMQMRLSVRDDGIGFDQSELSPDSLGLGIMRERLEAIDATLEIESETDQGTEIIALWQNEPDY